MKKREWVLGVHLYEIYTSRSLQEVNNWGQDNIIVYQISFCLPRNTFIENDKKSPVKLCSSQLKLENYSEKRLRVIVFPKNKKQESLNKEKKI